MSTASVKRPRNRIEVVLPPWMVERIEELSRKTGVSKGEVIHRALLGEIFPKAKKAAATVACLLAFLMPQICSAQEQSTPPLELKMTPAVYASAPLPGDFYGSTPAVGTIPAGEGITIKSDLLQTTPLAPVFVPEQAPKKDTPAPTPKKSNKMKKVRSGCSFITPFINFLAAIKNLFFSNN